MSKQDELNEVINGLRSAISDIQGVLIASTDGLPINHSISGGSDPGRVAAMAATALGVGRRISESLGAGTFSENTIRGSERQIFLYAAGPKAVLAILSSQDGNMGLIQMEARDAASKIAAILG